MREKQKLPENEEMAKGLMKHMTPNQLQIKKTPLLNNTISIASFQHFQQTDKNMTILTVLTTNYGSLLK